jgi:predicted DNA-binding protein (MmcQ/YjbR family)
MSDSKFPPVFLPQTPYAVALRNYALGFPGAWEDYPWGDVVYKVGEKIFLFLGGGGDTSIVTLKATPADADVLAQRPGIERAAYVGRFGWISVTIASEEDLEFTKDLIATSYTLIAPKKKRQPAKPQSL